MQNTIDINKKTLVDNVSENAAMLVSDHGKLVRYPIKKISGNRIFIYALGYGKDVEVGSYKMDLPPDELINEGIDYGDIIVDTDGGCIFQYVPEIGGDGDDGASLPAEGLHCIANPNGEKGDKGDKGEQGTQGVQGIKGKDGFLGNEYKGEYPDDVLYGDSDTVTFNSYTKANIGDYIIAEPSVMTQFGNAISLWMCTECEDIYGNGNEYKLTFKRKFSYGNVLPAVGEYIQKRVLVTENGSQPKWEDFPDSMVFKGGVNALPTTANEGDVYIVSPWENVDTYSDISMSLSIRSVSFSEWNGLANFLYSDVQSNYGCSYKFVIGGASYIYTECGDISASEEYFEMKGTTDDVASVVSVSGETVTVYKADAGADMIKKSYIYHNGKWEVGSEVYDDLKILSKIANLESGKANVTHNHSASNITS